MSNRNPVHWGAWGEFLFTYRGTIPVEEWDESIEYRLAPLSPIRAPVRNHWLGRGVRTVNLNGVIFPGSKIGARGGFDALRATAEKGIPLPLILGPHNEYLGNFFAPYLARQTKDLLCSLGHQILVRVSFVEQPQ